MTDPTRDVLDALEARGVGRGALLAVALAPGMGLGLALDDDDDPLAVAYEDPASIVAAIDATLRPRWVMWSIETATVLVGHGVRVGTSWDVAAVHRMLFGGWRAEPARAWARVQDLEYIPPADEPTLDLFTMAAFDEPPPAAPVADDGHLDERWARGLWASSPEHLARWAGVAAVAASRQLARIQTLPASTPVSVRLLSARSESTAELLCAELAFDGLPLRRDVAEAFVASMAGPRPATEHEAAQIRAERDADVLACVPNADDIDLRSPGQVKSLLRRAGIEVPDTRAWRLRELREAHPVVEALLAWRKAERIGTTYGYAWLDTHLGDDGRLRGSWSGSDGAAGRMTASAGLHNMPAEMRVAVMADPGFRFVRADLGQIEPRVLAAVSGDAALAAATQDDDLYAPVAQQLGVERAIAKVAVLGAMYGQSTGRGAQVAGRLEQSYPVAMRYLLDADRAAQGGRSLRTYGGRLVTMHAGSALDVDERDVRRMAAARGRYGRNAMVQGAAAELFKMWAAIVRARGAAIGARIVLCLHDELLVHVPADAADAAATLVADALDEAVARWAPDGAVRFVADIAVIDCWADAKA